MRLGRGSLESLSKEGLALWLQESVPLPGWEKRMWTNESGSGMRLSPLVCQSAFWRWEGRAFQESSPCPAPPLPGKRNRRCQRSAEQPPGRAGERMSKECVNPIPMPYIPLSILGFIGGHSPVRNPGRNRTHRTQRNRREGQGNECQGNGFHGLNPACGFACPRARMVQLRCRFAEPEV